MDDIKIYNNSKEILLKKESRVYISYIVILFILTSCLIVSLFIKYPKRYSATGIVNDNIVSLYLTKDVLKHIDNNIMLNNNKIKYEIGNLTYNEGIYILDIKVEEKIPNNINEFIIKDGYSNLYNDFIKKIWKGFTT